MPEHKRIGQYEILGEIGRGGSAVVYKARDTESGDTVALKVLRNVSGDQVEFVNRFEKETQIAASLDHPNIVPVYGSGDCEGDLYMAMALIGEGYSLRKLLKERTRLSLSEALPILDQLASALDYLHQLDPPLTHRDVKPANVLLEVDGDDWKVALADFGLVRSADASLRTETDAFKGTALYMAPEQADRRRGQITPQTDVYGLGVVVYEMLTGHVPFQGDTMSVLFDHANKEPPSPLDFVPDMDGELVEELKRALAKSPEQRYPSASALVGALHGVEKTCAHREKQQEELTRLLEQARNACETCDWISVQDICAKAVHIDSEHPEVIQIMGRAAEALRQASEEKAAYRQRAKRYQEGEQALEQGRWEEALAAFEEVAEGATDFPDVLEKLEYVRRMYQRERGTQASTIGKHQLEEVLLAAKQRVRLLGVVALNAGWERLAAKWAENLTHSTDFKITLLCESDNALFSRSFTYDTDAVKSDRRSFQMLKFVRDRAIIDLLEFLSERDVPDELVGSGKNVEIEITYLPVPLSVVQVDHKTFVNLWLHESEDTFEEINRDHPWYTSITRYVDTYFDPKLGRKYACSPGDEVLELFDHWRIPRGIYPRKSFYDTDYSQLVVWAFVFDRQGRLLIHRRSDNAKDNQGMWDKSVGGHINFLTDVDTSRAALREVIEELFSDELKRSKSDFTTWAVTDRDMVFLGEWRPDQRGRHPFSEIRAFEREWTFFRLRDSQQLYSPRTMPKGGERRLRVIADVFLFVAGPQLTDDSLGELKNSVFKLVEISELKNVMDRALRGEEIPGFDQSKPIPTFSPDLKNIMTGGLRTVLEEFSQFVKKYVKDREVR
ncbi:MAG: protein kinase [Anaerolineae bacterium]|nr:protein kinase [Anaerolineae bacterium]